MGPDVMYQPGSTMERRFPGMIIERNGDLADLLLDTPEGQVVAYAVHICETASPPIPSVGVAPLVHFCWPIEP